LVSLAAGVVDQVRCIVLEIDFVAKPYTRISRLLKVLTLIHSRAPATVDNIAEACGVAKRTVFRDLRELEGAGVPIHFDKEAGRYRILGGFFLPPVNLTPEEALALIAVADHAVENDQLPFAGPLREVTTKVRAQLPDKIAAVLNAIAPHTRVDLARSQPGDGFADVYELMREAIRSRTALRCAYEAVHSRSAESGDPTQPFTFHPYALLFSQRAWYSVGWHSGRDALRTLKLSRFSRCEATGDPYEIPADFSLDAYIGKAWLMICSGPARRVAVRFTPGFADTAADTRWHSTQEEELHDDGSVTLRFEVAGFDEIVWWVLSYGPNCVVVEPRELADRVRDLAAATLRRYADGQT
jgi:proteasome accessory factor B